MVSMQAFTTHRDPNPFPEPEMWNPERWLKGPIAGDMKELYMPFSKGPRACLGKNLALMELKLTAAALVLQCKMKVAPGTTEETMEMIDHFLAMPKNGRCELVFDKV